MRKLRHSNLLLKLCVTVAALVTSGCQQEKPANRTPTYPVTGTLHVNDQPAVGAMIKFYDPQSSGRMPTAVVREDGSFAASYYGAEDGAPAGEYQLLVLWMMPPPGGGLPVDRLEGRFSDASHPTRRVTIIKGENHLESINLKTKNQSIIRNES